MESRTGELGGDDVGESIGLVEVSIVSKFSVEAECEIWGRKGGVICIGE